MTAAQPWQRLLWWLGSLAFLLDSSESGQAHVSEGCQETVCREEEIELAEDQLAADLQVSLLQTQLFAPQVREDDGFAWSQAKLAVSIDNLKEALDMGVKQTLLHELSSMEQQCPNADEIKFQVGDLWPKLQDAVKADNIKDSIEAQRQTIGAVGESMKKDAEASKQKLKQMQVQYEEATKGFSKDQANKLMDVVSTRQQISSVKDAMMKESLGAVDMLAAEDKYKELEKHYADLTKDFSDVQLKLAPQAVAIKKDAEAVEKTLSKEYQEAELRHRTEQNKVRLKSLEEEYKEVTAEVDVEAVKQEYKKVWERSLKDLPEMEEHRKAYLAAKTPAK